MRSKTSLKYYPRVVMCLSLCLLTLYQQTTFEIYSIYFKVMLMLYLSITVGFL